MKKTAILSIVAAVVIGCVLTSARGQPHERDKTAWEMPFNGAILAVDLKSDPQVQSLLRNAAVKNFAGTDFLVGIESGEVADNSQKDRVTWIPIDNIAEIAEFADINEVTRARRASEEAQGEEKALNDELKRLLIQEMREKLSKEAAK